MVIIYIHAKFVSTLNESLLHVECVRTCVCYAQPYAVHLASMEPALFLTRAAVTRDTRVTHAMHVSVCMYMLMTKTISLLNPLIPPYTSTTVHDRLELYMYACMTKVIHHFRVFLTAQMLGNNGSAKKT